LFDEQIGQRLTVHDHRFAAGADLIDGLVGALVDTNKAAPRGRCRLSGKGAVLTRALLSLLAAQRLNREVSRV
jgi:hypothetical protein